MPSNGFDPRFDVQKPEQLSGNTAGDDGEAVAVQNASEAAVAAAEQQAMLAAATRMRATGEGVQGLARTCGAAWIPEAAFKGALQMKSKHSHGAPSTLKAGSCELPGGPGKRQVCVRRLRAGLLSDAGIEEMAADVAVLTRIRHSCLVETLGMGVGAPAGSSGEGATRAEASAAMAQLEPFVVVANVPGADNIAELLTRQMETPYRRLYSEEDALRWCLQAGRGLRCLHESAPPIVHRDVRPGNLLLATASGKSGQAADTDCMVTGQGLHALLVATADTYAEAAHYRMALKRGGQDAANAMRRQQQQQQQRNAAMVAGSAPTSPSGGLDGKAARSELNAHAELALYMAPEVFRGERYDDRADVYSFALILHELLTREQVYYAARSRDQVGDVYSYMDQVALQGERPVIPNRMPQPLADLVRRCWHPTPAERPPMSEVVATLKGYMEARAIPEKASARGTFVQDSTSCGCGPGGGDCAVM